MDVPVRGPGHVTSQINTLDLCAPSVTLVLSQSRGSNFLVLTHGITSPTFCYPSRSVSPTSVRPVPVTSKTRHFTTTPSSPTPVQASVRPETTLTQGLLSPVRSVSQVSPSRETRGTLPFDDPVPGVPSRPTVGTNSDSHHGGSGCTETKAKKDKTNKGTQPTHPRPTTFLHLTRRVVPLNCDPQL